MNRSSIGKINAISIYISWIFLAVLVVGLGFIMFGVRTDGLAVILISGFSGLLLFSVIHFILSFFVRCPSCNKCLTAQGFSTPSNDSSGRPNSWSYVAIRWFSGNVYCIHCNAKVDINALNPKAWVACVAGVSLFSDPSNNQVFLTFSLVYFLVCYFSLFFWSVSGDKVTMLLNSEFKLKLFNQLMGGLLIVTASFLLYSQFN